MKIIQTIEASRSVVVKRVPAPHAVKIVRLTLVVPHAEVCVFLNEDQTAALLDALLEEGKP